MLSRAVIAAAVVVSSGIAACGTDDPAGPSKPSGVTACDGTPMAALARVSPARSVRPTQCGSTLDFTPINKYQGEIASIEDREDAVVLINGSCTGTLIAAAAGPIVLTAGHCVGLGDVSLVAFNVEADPDGDPLVTNGTVIEQSTEPDYALIDLDQLPTAVPVPLTTRPTDRLAIIQHPRGAPKVVAEGSFAASCNQMIYYTDLDTLVGSSGAGVLNQQGYLLGVHTDGDCDEDGNGSNTGWTAAGIVDASPYLQDVDIADR